MKEFISKLSTVSTDTWIRTIVSIVAVCNQIVTYLGINPLSVCNESWYSIISAVATIITFLWSWWKNNSFSQAAIEADKVMTQLKSSEE